MTTKDMTHHEDLKKSTRKGGWFYRGVIALFYVYMKLFFRLKISYIDKESIQALGEGPYIIAPNHISYLDPPLVAASWPGPLHFFASEHLFQQSKWFSWILGRLNSHPVNRDHGVQAIKDAIHLLHKERKSIVVFPEGTRSADGVIKQELEEGVAFMSVKAECPIIPAYIKGAYQIWPRNRAFPRCWGKLSIVFGRPIDPSTFEETGRNRIHALTNRLRQELEALSKREE